MPRHFNKKFAVVLLTALSGFTGINSSAGIAVVKKPLKPVPKRKLLSQNQYNSEIPRLDINLNIVRDMEAMDTNVYWPGGCSGPTVGVGFDLGYASPQTVELVFHGLVDSTTMQVLLSAHGVHGSRSLAWVLDHPVHITRQQADVTFFRVTRIYWHETEKRFGSGVDKLDPTVKGVLLSLVMNYGGSNSALDPVAVEISNGNIVGLAETVRTLSIGSTIDSHMQTALTKRRRVEHDFVNKTQSMFDSVSEVDPD
jgi:hypothetical protein